MTSEKLREIHQETPTRVKTDICYMKRNWTEDLAEEGPSKIYVQQCQITRSLIIILVSLVFRVPLHVKKKK